MKKSYQHTRWLRSFGQHGPTTLQIGPLGYFTGESSTGLFYTEELFNQEWEITMGINHAVQRRYV